MIIKGKGLLLAAGVLGSILAGSPAMAQSHGGGGGHAGGGGGAHFSGGGGHATAGAHFGGGGGAHFSGPAYRGAAGAGRGFSGTGAVHAYSGRGAPVYHGGYVGRPGFSGHYYAGGGGYAYNGGHYWRGYSTGATWRGGYWRGGWWPRAYYGAGFSWFLPVLPLAYATYWWGGLPYYYANDVYYTYSNDYQGYVATDPPPVSEQSDASASVAPGDAAPPPPSGSADVFMYPKNGQSAEQQAQDRTECQSWATQQAGPVAQNGADYRRAMIACVEGRGYSAK